VPFFGASFEAGESLGVRVDRVDDPAGKAEGCKNLDRERDAKALRAASLRGSGFEKTRAAGIRHVSTV
jgi:hypothetical protein